MVALLHSSLTNSQLWPRRSRAGRLAKLVSHLGDTLHVWRRRISERRALVRLTDSELRDFGASRGDVYRELATPFWRSQPPC